MSDLQTTDAAPSSTEPASGGNSTENAGISAAANDAPNAAGGASSVEQSTALVSASGATDGGESEVAAAQPGESSVGATAESAGTEPASVVPADSAPSSDVPNVAAPTAAGHSESDAESSASPASVDGDTAESPAPATTDGEPHPALTHLDEIEAMVERMYYRAEEFAVHEWKAVINAARAVL